MPPATPHFRLKPSLLNAKEIRPDDGKNIRLCDKNDPCNVCGGPEKCLLHKQARASSAIQSHSFLLGTTHSCISISQIRKDGFTLQEVQNYLYFHYVRPSHSPNSFQRNLAASLKILTESRVLVEAMVVVPGWSKNRLSKVFRMSAVAQEFMKSLVMQGKLDMWQKIVKGAHMVGEDAARMILLDLPEEEEEELEDEKEEEEDEEKQEEEVEDEEAEEEDVEVEEATSKSVRDASGEIAQLQTRILQLERSKRKYEQLKEDHSALQQEHSALQQEHSALQERLRKKDRLVKKIMAL